MRNALRIGALAASALCAGAATAAPLVVGDSVRLVIDVEFWGREQLTSFNPDDPNNDIITYGDPVQGMFRYSPADAPPPNLTADFLDLDDAVVYGRDTRPIGNQPPASFVTSRLLSTPPAGGATLTPLPGSVADDYVKIGDAVRFRPNEPDKDWFQIADAYTINLGQPGEYQQTMFITTTTPLDIIQGLGLEQEFDIDTSAEDSSGYGFFRTQVNGVRTFMEFIVDRVRVSPRVCRM